MCVVVSGMSTRLRRFRMPRGSLGDLRKHMLRQLQDQQRMAALPGRQSWLRSTGQAEVKMWLGIGGDSLQSIAGFVEDGVRSRAGSCVTSLSSCGLSM
jgi:hypothetical protein